MGFILNVVFLSIYEELSFSTAAKSFAWVSVFACFQLCSLSVRRLHDVDKDGKSSLLFVVALSCYLAFLSLSGLLFSFNLNTPSWLWLPLGLVSSIFSFLCMALVGNLLSAQGNKQPNRYGVPTNYGWRLGTILFGEERQ